MRPNKYIINTISVSNHNLNQSHMTHFICKTDVFKWFKRNTYNFFVYSIFLSLVLFLLYKQKGIFHIFKKSILQGNAQWSNQCRKLIQLIIITLPLLQGERHDSDVVEERNAQVQLEKAKVLFHCSWYHHDPTHRGPHRHIFSEQLLSRTWLHHRQ